jgi:hypothetical protein
MFAGILAVHGAPSAGVAPLSPLVAQRFSQFPPEAELLAAYVVGQCDPSPTSTSGMVGRGERGKPPGSEVGHALLQEFSCLDRQVRRDQRR